MNRPRLKHLSLVGLFTAATIFLIPFNVGKIISRESSSVAGIDVNFYHIRITIQDITVLGLLISYLWESKSILRKYILRPPWSIAIFALLFVIHNIVHHNTTTLFHSTKLVIYIAATLVVFLDIPRKSEKVKPDNNRCHNKSQYKWAFALTIVIQTIIVALHAITQNTVGLEFLGESQYRFETIGRNYRYILENKIFRAQGTFPHPNLAGGFFAITTVILLNHLPTCFRKDRNKRKSKKLHLVLSLSLLFCSTLSLLLTFSYTAIVAAASAGTVLFFGILLQRKGQNRTQTGSSWIVIATALFGTIVIPATILVFYHHIERANVPESLSTRVELTKNSLCLIKKHPIWGTGHARSIAFGAEQPDCPGLPTTQTGRRIFEPVHNVPLLFLSEWGLAGISVVIMIFRDTRTKQKSDFAYITPAFTRSLFFSLCILASFDHYLLTLQQGMLLPLLAIIGGYLLYN